MKDVFLYMQIMILAMNVIAFIYIMHEEKYNYKLVRVAVLIVLTAFMIPNIGKLNFATVLFTFSTFLSLIKIDLHNGNIHRFIEKFRIHFGGHKQHLQKLQGGHKALHREKA